MSAPQLYLVDASIYIFRNYFALPENWFSKEGIATSAVQGYASWLLTLLHKQQPQYIAAAYDESLGSGFRHQLYPHYKANRALPDDDLAFQLLACRQLAELLGIYHLASDTYEADDLIGTLASYGRQQQLQPVIISRDKDLAQLVQQGEVMWDFPNEQPETPQQLEANFGVRLWQLADYLALVGDGVDNIPGVPGIGKKTAAALLGNYDSIEQLFANLHLLSELPVRGASSLPSKLADYQSQLQVMQQLTRIKCDVPLEFAAGQTRSRLRWKGVDQMGFAAFCEHMGLSQQLLTRAAKLPSQ